jgi:hypothetical protein
LASSLLDTDFKPELCLSRRKWRWSRGAETPRLIPKTENNKRIPGSFAVVFFVEAHKKGSSQKKEPRKKDCHFNPELVEEQEPPHFAFAFVVACPSLKITTRPGAPSFAHFAKGGMTNIQPIHNALALGLCF